ncbi:TRAP transporter small permease subunit [Roseovarius atlanticus]|uniref:TRAP transporter small permease subunit n=1 Tax=Roseovarius atlanticus TaxID=1641875 RepID=UPI001C939604|nr:TRAP transporter small permease subunit [Roseovarius atlanticus]MBY5989146.1 TRAP transporter small permease subunit [Roseovarius atlanticus]MBY6124538.1 TRAP transporter small permease subunit [Roseovarius atlanticus]MBY6149033.1 TRAP transporter small permease subunit [Roseovarius atlanticus]
MDATVQFLFFCGETLWLGVTGYAALFPMILGVAREGGVAWGTVIALVFLLVPVAFLLAAVLTGLSRGTVSDAARVLDRLARLTSGAAAGLLLVLSAIMLFEVMSRYLLGRPTIWSFELSYMLMGTIFFLGANYCLQRDQHVRVDFFYDWGSARKRTVTNILGYTASLPMLLWMLAGFSEYFERSFVQGIRTGNSVWNPSVWPFRLVFVLGTALLILQVFSELLKGCGALTEERRARVGETDD